MVSTPSDDAGRRRRTTRCVISTAFLATAIATTASASGEVSAQADQTEWVDLDAAPAVCEQPPSGSTWGAPVGIDCAVPIVTDVDPTFMFADAVDTAFDTRTPCTVQLDGVPDLVDDGPALLCSNVGAVDAADDARDIRLEVTYSDVGSLGIRDSDAAEEIYFFDGQAVFDGSTLGLIDRRGDERVGELHLVVRERRTARDVTRIPASEIRRDGTDLTVDVDLPIGHYRFWPCVGDDVESCEEQPGGYPFESISPSFSPLIPGRNSDPDGRINLLFVGHDLDSARFADAGADVERLAIEMLGLDGPVESPTAGPPNPARPDREFAWGPFAIEPLRSNLDKFNFWVLDQPVGSTLAFGTTPLDGEPADRGFGLPNVSIVFVSGVRSPEGNFANPAPFGAEMGVPTRDRIVFGNAYMKVTAPSARGVATVFAHELGHSLFGLADEYTGTDGPRVASEWNCRPTRADAEQAWADVLGDTDPFAQEVIDELTRRGVDTSRFDLVDDTTASVTKGGCVGAPDAEAFRPSEQSLMNQQVPVFGPVNRARVEAVLDRFRSPTERIPVETIRATGLPRTDRLERANRIEVSSSVRGRE